MTNEREAELKRLENKFKDALFCSTLYPALEEHGIIGG